MESLSQMLVRICGRPTGEVREAGAAILGDRWIAYRGALPRTLMAAIRLGDGRNQQVRCWSDGSGTSGSFPAGVGVVVRWPGGPTEALSYSAGLASNNRAEILAVRAALIAVPDAAAQLEIVTDSQYAIGVLDRNHRARDHLDVVGAVRADIAARRHIGGELAVQLHHVRGHRGNEGNETADLLAKAGRRLSRLIGELDGVGEIG